MQILRRLITGQPLRQATQGAATLNAGSVLSTAATAGPDLAALWAAYLAAAANSAKLVDYWRQLHSSSRTDGTVGQIYAQLYVADQAKDAAYKAWEIAWRRINSQAPPSGPAT